MCMIIIVKYESFRSYDITLFEFNFKQFNNDPIGSLQLIAYNIISTNIKFIIFYLHNTLKDSMIIGIL